MKLKIGDVVELKAGGQRMTVDEVKGDSVTCLWMTYDKGPERASFKTATLKKVETSEETIHAVDPSEPPKPYRLS